MYEREKTVMLAGSASLLPNNVCRLNRNGKVWVGVIHRDQVSVVCSSHPEAEPRNVQAQVGCHSTTPVMQASWVSVHGRDLLVLATVAGVLIYEWDGSVLLHAHLLPTPKPHAHASFTRGIAAMTSGTVCVGTHSGETLLLPIDEELNVGEVGDVRFHAHPITALASSGLMLASGDDQGNIVVAEDIEGLRRTGDIIETYGSPVTSLAIHSDVIIAGYLSGHLRLFGLLDQRIVAEVSAHVRGVTGLDVAKDSGLLLSAAEDTFLRVWQLDRNDVPIEHKYSHRETDVAVCGARFTDGLGAGYVTTGYDRLDLLCYAM